VHARSGHLIHERHDFLTDTIVYFQAHTSVGRQTEADSGGGIKRIRVVLMQHNCRWFLLRRAGLFKVTFDSIPAGQGRTFSSVAEKSPAT